jgi:hypothetical protein
MAYQWQFQIWNHILKNPLLVTMLGEKHFPNRLSIYFNNYRENNYIISMNFSNTEKAKYFQTVATERI